MNNESFAFIIFAVSLFLTLLPLFISRLLFLKRMYPFLTTYAAGFMLAVMLVEFIPHHTKDHSHGHEEGTGHGHTHKHGHKHKNEDAIIDYGLFTAGLTFIFLLAIDSLVLNHTHCHNAGFVDHSAHTHDAIGGCNVDALRHSTSFAQSGILVLALSIHSFFEGLVMKQDKVFFYGMLIHKVLESLALGFAINSTNKQNRRKIGHILVLSIIYAALTPAGMLLAGKMQPSNNMKKVINGLALGSTLFITCHEMIPPMFHKKGTFKEDLAKVLLLGGGFVSTCFFIALSHKAGTGGCC